MRFIKFLFFASLLLIPASVFADDLGLARLSLIDGDVQVLIQDSTDWTEAAINLPLNERDRLWVADDSKAELQIQGGVYARADDRTSMDILTITSDSSQFYLDQGHVYINNRRGGVKIVQVDTPLTSLRSYDNSIMMVDVTEDGTTEVSVLKGYVYAESRAGATRVSAGNTLTLRGEDSAELAPISSPDAWEQWNIDRDRKLTAWSESSRYLPDELHEYSSDFDDNGHWDYVSDYGYVWIPSTIAADWAPYTYGSWVWIRGSYVWIDYDPWGWAPCHYGRWVFVTTRGWCWVPPVAGAAYWGPGYVGWIVTPTYVAWVPLAPGEVYYGYGYYGPGSVNITNININTVIVNRRYGNARWRNSVTVVRRDSFGTGRHVPERLSENPFEGRQERDRGRQDIHIVPPPVRPQQPIVIVPDRERQRRQAPPERVRQAGPATRRDLPVTPAETIRVRPETPPSVRTERTERTERQSAPPVVAPQTPQPRPAQQLPPERVRSTRPAEIKNERPLVRQRESSVFRPQQPENLPVKKSSEPRVIIRRPAAQTQTGGQQPQKKQGEQRRERGRE